jgi:integrase-like protein
MRLDRSDPSSPSVRCSPLADGDCPGCIAALDNAAAEAFNTTLKVEFVHRQTFKTRAEARIKVATWIADSYNTTRRHSANDGLAPITFEGQMAQKRSASTAQLRAEPATRPVGDEAQGDQAQGRPVAARMGRGHDRCASPREHLQGPSQLLLRRVRLSGDPDAWKGGRPAQGRDVRPCGRHQAGVDDDVDFLHRVIHVRRQVKLIRGTRVFAPLKNDNPHDVPLSDSLASR